MHLHVNNNKTCNHYSAQNIQCTAYTHTLYIVHVYTSGTIITVGQRTYCIYMYVLTHVQYDWPFLTWSDKNGRLKCAACLSSSSSDSSSYTAKRPKSKYLWSPLLINGSVKMSLNPTAHPLPKQTLYTCELPSTKFVHSTYCLAWHIVWPTSLGYPVHVHTCTCTLYNTITCQPN